MHLLMLKFFKHLQEFLENCIFFTMMDVKLFE